MVPAHPNMTPSHANMAPSHPNMASHPNTAGAQTGSRRSARRARRGSLRPRRRPPPPPGHDRNGWARTRPCLRQQRVGMIRWPGWVRCGHA
eukprot:7112748-Prymnesium_polylepis.1